MQNSISDVKKIAMLIIGFFVISWLYIMTLRYYGIVYKNKVELSSILIVLGDTGIKIGYFIVIDKVFIRLDMFNKLTNKISCLIMAIIGYILGTLSFGCVILLRKALGLIENIRLSSSITPIYILEGIILVFAPVVIEELLFRKYIFNILSNKFQSWIKATIISSILFAVSHISDNRGIVDLLFYFLFGVLLCTLAQNYNSIYIGMGFHMGWNYLTSQIGIIVSYKIESSRELLMAKFINIIIIILINLILILYYKNKEIKSIEPPILL